MKRHLMVLVTLLFVATSSWGAGFTGLDRIWMQDATLNGSANQYWGTVDAFLEANELDNLGNAVFSTVNVVGSAGLAIGTAGTADGTINLKSGTAANSFLFEITGGNFTENVSLLAPLSMPTGVNFLLSCSVTTGQCAWTDPSTLGGGAPEGTAVVSTGVAAGWLLKADGDNTSSWTQTITASIALQDASSTVDGALTFDGTLDQLELGDGTITNTFSNDTVNAATYAPIANDAASIVSGTSALGTALIASGACATTVNTSATGMATTDVAMWGFNGDPTAVTGYAPTADGMLTIISWPSVNNINFDVCNLTAAGITPGAITLNWRVLR